MDNRLVARWTSLETSKALAAAKATLPVRYVAIECGNWYCECGNLFLTDDNCVKCGMEQEDGIIAYRADEILHAIRSRLFHMSPYTSGQWQVTVRCSARRAKTFCHDELVEALAKAWLAVLEAR